VNLADSAGRLVTDEDEMAQIVRSAKVVAVLGMKDERQPMAPAYEIPKVLLARGLRVIPVNPRIRESLGVPSHPNLASVREPVDILDIFRRSSHIPAHTDEILALPPAQRPRVVWMQSGIRDEASAERLALAGILVVMDACLGVYAARYRARASEG